MKYIVKVSERRIENELIYRKNPVLKYSLKYPFFSSDKFHFFIGRLNHYYYGQALNLKNCCHRTLYSEASALFCESENQGFPFYEYEFDSAYTLTYNQNCTLSLYFDQEQYTGGANGSMKRIADSWDLKEQRRILLGGLLPNSCQDVIEVEVNKQIAEQLKSNEGYYFDGYKKLVSQYFDPQNFYITPKSVAVFYQETTIAPHSSSIVSFDLTFGGGIAKEPNCG